MAQEHVSNFLVSFKESEKKIDYLLNKSIASHEDFKLASIELQKLTRFVSEHASSLPSYELRKAQAVIASFQSKIIDIGETSQPKSKFKFSRKAKEPVKSENLAVSKTIDQPDCQQKLQSVLVPSVCGVQDETLVFDSTNSSLKDVWLDNLKNCSVIIRGVPSTLHITKLDNCRIVAGPILTSIFLENCVESVFIMGCQQLRVHKSKGCDFYLHVRSRAIIEDCISCRFAPYNREYEEKDKEFAEAQLDSGANNWDQVDDFNWLSTDTASPNWSILPQEERIINWNTGIWFTIACWNIW